MSRPPRTQFPGALHHVTARGNRKANIFLDDSDYRTWLSLVDRAADRFGFVCHAYCQMPNHFHLLVETPTTNLSEAMHFVNCNYAQLFNVRHGLTGHVLQGRFHSVLVTEESHFLELGRYITLNPVRAGIVPVPEDWRWSSYRATAGLDEAPFWLDTATVRMRFNGESDKERISAYRDFVIAGVGGRNPLKPPALPELDSKVNRSQAIRDALRTGHYSPSQIAAHFQVSTKTVQRIRAADEAAR